MKRILSILLVLLSFVGALSAQAVTTLGKDFWVTFIKARNTGTDPTLTLIIAGRNSCTGRVENPNTGWFEDFAVTEGSITNVAIPLEQAYTTALAAPTDKGLHVTSTDTIAVFASNYQSAVFDISNVYPTAALMSDYMVQSFRGAVGMSGEFVIVATEDNTTVNVTPTADCTSHNDNIITNIYAGSTFTISLNAGQCLLMRANSSAADFSGSTVKAMDCKKVAVFSGCEGMQMPYGIAYIDLAFEQCVPTAYWGRNFVVTASMMRTADRIKVTSLRDSCDIKLDGVTQTTIMAGESYMFEITPDNPAVYMQTTQPVCTYLYFTGGEYGGYYGDPSTALINPIEQQIDDITFPTYNTDSTRFHFVNIVAETSRTQGITIDGMDISEQFSPIAGNPLYSYARVEITHGSHRLRSTSGGFVAHIYGLGPHESYSYSAGSSAVNLNKQMKVNDIVGIPGKEIRLCSLDAAIFTIVANYDISQVTWDFGGGSTAEGMNVSHAFNDYGSYEVSAVIRRALPDPCSGAVFDTVRNTIVIVEPESHTMAASCGSYVWNGNTYYESGDYEFHTTQLNTDCDSTAHLHLELTDTYNIDISETSCNLSYLWNGTEYIEPGDYQAMLSSINGCDSLVTLHLSFTDIPEVEIIGDPAPPSGNEITFSQSQYSVVTTTSASIDSVVWVVDCPNWHVVPQGNGEVCDLFIHTYIADSIALTATVYFDCGQVTTAMWIRTSEIGIKEKDVSHISIMPNPNNGTMLITAKEDKNISQLDVYDMQGKLVKSFAALQGPTQITLDLPDGVYSFVFNAEGRTICKNVVISKH